MTRVVINRLLLINRLGAGMWVEGNPQRRQAQKAMARSGNTGGDCGVPITGKKIWLGAEKQRVKTPELPMKSRLGGNRMK